MVMVYQSREQNYEQMILLSYKIVDATATTRSLFCDCAKSHIGSPTVVRQPLLCSLIVKQVKRGNNGEVLNDRFSKQD